MKHLAFPLSAILSVVIPLSAFAQSASGELQFDVDLHMYNDAPWNHQTDLAVSVLTEQEILFGNPDGSFYPERTLNRAEFMQIAMRLLPDAPRAANLNCFPDVQTNAWYAEPVCRAKYLGIVRGNADVGLPPDQWRFQPGRDVQYEEAIKVLIQLYALPISGDVEGDDWYVPYIQKAASLDLDIGGMQPGDRITRGEMAQLTLGFLAHTKGQLGEYREAEENDGAHSSSSSSRMSSSRSSSSMSSTSSSSTSSVGSGQTDPDTDVSIRSSILVLGDTTPVLGAVQFFSNNEPVLVDTITINLIGNPQSVQSMVVYTADGELLGTASKIGLTGSYQLSIPDDWYSLPYRESRSVYVRARLKADDGGGESDETVQIDDIVLRGTGEWSNDDYQTSSTGDFEMFRTAVGSIVSVENAGVAQSAFVAGNNQLIGQFRFRAETSSTVDDVELQTLRFQINQTGNVTVSNVRIRTDVSSQEHSCTVSAGVITCSNIPTVIGEVDPSVVIRVYGDVASSSTDATLRLTLNEPGTAAGGGGSVVWTDGDTTFEWVPLTQPVAQGTLYN